MAEVKDKLIIGIDLDTGEITKDFKKIQKQSKNTSKKMSKNFKSATSSMSGAFGGLKTKILGIGAAFAGAFAVRGIFEAGKNIESLRTRFEVLLKSTKAANDQIRDLQKFAASTPFELNKLANANAILIAFGFNAKSSIKSLKEIGNAAAGSGKDLGEIALIYGQVGAAGKLTGERLLQLQERGINLAPVLAKNLGVAEGSIKKLAGTGKISAKQFQQAFTDMTTGTGLFAGATEKLSKTLGGLASTLGDNFEALKVELAEVFGPFFKIALKQATKGFQFLTMKVKENRVAISEYIRLGLLKLITGLQTANKKIRDFFKEWKEVAKIAVATLIIGKFLVVIANLKNAFSTLGMAKLLLNPIAASVIAVGALIVAFKKLNDAQKTIDANRPLKEQIENTKKVIGLLKEKLLIKQKEVTEGDGLLSRVAAASAVDSLSTQLANATMQLADLQVARKKALGGSPEDNQDIIDDTSTLLEELKLLLSAPLVTDDEGEKSNILTKIAPTPEEKEEFKNSFVEMFKSLNVSWDNSAATMKKTSVTLAAQFKSILVKGIAGGVQNIVDSVMSGENAFANFGKFVMGVLADMATQFGTTLIGAGIGVDALKQLGGAAAVAAGIGLVALGAVMKNLSGGGESTPSQSFSGGGSGNIPIVQDEDIAQISDEEEREAKTIISANFLGPILDRKESALAIIDILQEGFDEEGVQVIKGIGA